MVWEGGRGESKHFVIDQPDIALIVLFLPCHSRLHNSIFSNGLLHILRMT